MLQAPSNHELSGSTRVLFRQRHDAWVLHPQSPRQRGIRFDDDVMLCAKGGNLGPSIERMYFDLVDDGVQSRFRSEKLSQLKRV